MFLGELLKYFGTLALSLKTKHDSRLELQCEFKRTEKNRKAFNSANSECGFSPTKALQKTNVTPAPKPHPLPWHLGPWASTGSCREASIAVNAFAAQIVPSVS